MKMGSNSNTTITENKNLNKTMSAKRIVRCAFFAALLCVAAYISFPLPLPGAPKITMINFVLFLIALLFPLADSIMIVAVWFLLGLVGVPVYIGGGSGVGYLVNPYGFYTMAFPIVAIVLPLIRGAKYNRIRYTICAIIGVLIIDLIGMIYLKIQMNYDLKTALLIGFVSFLPLDIVKAVIVAQIIPAFNRVMQA